MTTLTRRAVDAYQSANMWLIRRPYMIALVLAGFGLLFGAYCAYDFSTGNTEGGKLAAVCMVLAAAATVFESVRALRKYIAAGQGA